MTLPVILMYVLRRDVSGDSSRAGKSTRLAEPIEIAVLGLLVLAMSPLFVRLAWPTHSLPAGALRRRLERAAERVGFRFTDVLVWDTGQMMVNACVTGILPGFRYVLLSDALLESLTPLSRRRFSDTRSATSPIAISCISPFSSWEAWACSRSSAISSRWSVPCLPQSSWLTPWSAAVLSELIQGGALLIALGLYFWFVFGYLSRRFERQADVYGSKVVSCDLADCPPHTDLDNELAPEPAVGRQPSLCPVGIRIFADALTNVARFNGLDRNEPILAARQHRQPDRVSRRPRTASGARTATSSAGFAGCGWALASILTTALVISAVSQDLGVLRLAN